MQPEKNNEDAAEHDLGQDKNMAEGDTMQDKETVQDETIKDEKMQAGADQACGLEALFAQAEELIAQMESPRLSLEEAFAAYEQGMKVIARCNERIDAVEKRMLMMNEQGALVPFEESGGR